MLEYCGAIGILPGSLAWWEIDRMFLGWRRQQDISFARLWAAVLCVFGAKVKPSDMSDLIPCVNETGTGSGVSFAMFKQAFQKKKVKWRKPRS